MYEHFIQYVVKSGLIRLLGSSPARFTCQLRPVGLASRYLRSEIDVRISSHASVKCQPRTSEAIIMNSKLESVLWENGNI